MRTSVFTFSFNNKVFRHIVGIANKNEWWSHNLFYTAINLNTWLSVLMVYFEGLMLWCLTPLSTIFSYIVAVSFIDRGKRSNLKLTIKGPKFIQYFNRTIYSQKLITALCLKTLSQQMDDKLFDCSLKRLLREHISW